jgi:hypothetical protein
VALLGNLTGSSPLYFNKDPNFYNGVITSSCRLNGSNSRLASPAFGSDLGDTWTWSAWVKFNNQNTDKRGTLFGIAGNNASLYFDSSGQSFLSINDDGAVVRSTSRLLRDPSSWYHIVLNGNGTLNKLWINGELATFGTNANLGSINTAVVHYIGFSIGSAYYFEGQIADINFVSETALDYTAFAEEKNGVLIPKEPSVTYGANGFRLQFKQTGSGADANGIGADTSGNNKHFTATNLNAYDVLPDSPENNFCTLNSVGRRYGQSYVSTFSEGNLKVASGGNATNVFGTMAINQIASQGGVYFEVRMDSLDTSRTYFGVVGDTGVNNKNPYSNAGGYTFPIKGMLSRVPRGYFTTDTDASNSVDLTANTAFSDGDVIGIAILSDGKFFAHRNGTYLDNASGNTGNPSTGANPIATIDLTLGDWFPYVGYNSAFSVNFGQDGTFQGNETSGGNQDANGIGDFMFAVPTNCFAICSSNMAEPTIGANSATQADDHFNTVLYTGNATGSTGITGVGFQPDWVWIKNRATTNSHALFDSSRGSGSNGFYRLATNLTTEEQDPTNVASLDSDGFTLGSNAGTNGNGNALVAWNWKANGGTTTSFSESGNNPAGTHQANATAGFSIVTYTGTGADGTISHGLGAKPAWYFVKNRDVDTHNWLVWHQELATNGAMSLNLTAAAISASARFTSNEPTTSVFYVGSDGSTNADGEKFIAYVFAEVEGYSRFGSYTGNGSTDGTFVFTGFRPALIILKQTSATNSWRIMDNKRDGYNGSTKVMYPSANNAEGSEVGVDFLSNGFKFRATDGGQNASGGTFIYMAFAEAPFKYANAR